MDPAMTSLSIYLNFQCPLTNILNTEALFPEGRQVFVLPLGGFLLIIYFLGRLSRKFFYISKT